MAAKNNAGKSKSRAAVILGIFAKHNFYANGLTPYELRTTLEDLGPTYVKIGQIMSSRTDLLPKAYCTELEKLRSSVQPLPAETVRAVIESESGKAIDEIYSEFRDKPLGSASIAQAHYGVLRDGTKVVTKVQRPGIAEMMRDDFVLLKKLAEVCNQLGADMLWFDRVIIPAEEDIHGLALSAAEYKRLCKTAARLSKNGIVTCGRALQFIPCREKHIYKCTAGDSHLALLADGTVMPCRRLPLIAGNIKHESLLSIYRESPVLQRLRALEIPDGCKACKYKEMCRGGSKCAAYAKTGRYDTADPDCCRLSRERDARPGPRFVTSYNSFLQFPAL